MEIKFKLDITLFERMIQLLHIIIVPTDLVHKNMK